MSKTPPTVAPSWASASRRPRHAAGLAPAEGLLALAIGLRIPHAERDIDAWDGGEDATELGITAKSEPRFLRGFLFSVSRTFICGPHSC